MKYETKNEKMGLEILPILFDVLQKNQRLEIQPQAPSRYSLFV